ncbi:hypothetical protein GCM10011608_55890 [Micromonospora sonchi]|uniref:Uncharacterized protein n=1 Tax=Micromonospora sonchi TaxID=1763543 RepID=A0A917X468_9ACTN|nr:hypothetical protein GCM10011608_55890 [Micromonospora sonchi]
MGAGPAGEIDTERKAPHGSNIAVAEVLPGNIDDGADRHGGSFRVDGSKGAATSRVRAVPGGWGPALVRSLPVTACLQAGIGGGTFASVEAPDVFAGRHRAKRWMVGARACQTSDGVGVRAGPACGGRIVDPSTVENLGLGRVRFASVTLTYLLQCRRTRVGMANPLGRRAEALPVRSRLASSR